MSYRHHTAEAGALAYDMSYRLADASEEYQGQCLALSGTEIKFLSDQILIQGRALEIKVRSGNGGSLMMTAFVEVLQVMSDNEGHFLISAAIRTIKGL